MGGRTLDRVALLQVCASSPRRDARLMRGFVAAVDGAQRPQRRKASLGLAGRRSWWWSSIRKGGEEEQRTEEEDLSKTWVWLGGCRAAARRRCTRAGRRWWWVSVAAGRRRLRPTRGLRQPPSLAQRSGSDATAVQCATVARVYRCRGVPRSRLADSGSHPRRQNPGLSSRDETAATRNFRAHQSPEKIHGKILQRTS